MAARHPARIEAQVPDCDPPLPRFPLPWHTPLPSAYDGVTLNLSGKLSAEQTDIWAGQEHLQALILDENGLTSLSPDAFVNLPRLQVLFLSYNALTSLPPDLFRPLPCLRELYLSANALTNLPPDLFANLTHLEVLNLNGNQLKYLPRNLFADLTRLEMLSLYNNRQTHLLSGLFTNLTRLEFLGLGGNQLVHLPPSLFANLTRLEVLDLYNNQLWNLPPDLFHSLENLQRLRLDGNELSSLPPDLFADLMRLEVLRLDNNHLAALAPNLFHPLENLQQLDLSRNQLTCLPSDLFAGLLRLQTLGLRNRLGNLDPVFLQILGLTQVQALELGPEANQAARHRQTRPFGVYDPYEENNLPMATFARYAAVFPRLEALTLSANTPLTYPICIHPRAVHFAAGADAPLVGRALVAETIPPSLPYPAWHWERCTDAEGQHCLPILSLSPTPQAAYVPGLDDIDRYLRAYLAYLDADGAWTRLQTPLAGPITSIRCPAAQPCQIPAG